MSISTPQADERVKNVQIQEDTFSVELMDGRTITVPLAWYPRLLKATPEQLQVWEICGGGYGIHWKEINVDVDIRTEELLRGSSAHQKSRSKRFKKLNISSKFILIYLSLKLIIFPVIQIVINIISGLKSQEKIADSIIKIPDTNFPEIILLIIILLLQPEASKIFKTLDLSPKGLKAEFKDLKNKVNKNQEEIDNFQQKQIDAIKKLQNFMFMNPLLLAPKMIEKLQWLKKHTENNTDFKFKVTDRAASELRSLRDSGLIKIKEPYKYVSRLQGDSKDGENYINLAEYCELTKLGEDFLERLAQISTETNN